MEEKEKGFASDETGPDLNTRGENPEHVHILNGALGLFKIPEIGPETEEEVKARRELNDVVHRMLIVGLLISTAIMFLGLILSAISGHHLPTRVWRFREMLNGLKKGSPESILSLGILLLIATPVFRVLGSLIEFLIKRDWRFAVITFSVLTILAISVLFGSR